MQPLKKLQSKQHPPTSPERFLVDSVVYTIYTLIFMKTYPQYGLKVLAIITNN